MSKNMHTKNKSLILFLIYAFSFLMSNGPGVLLVNSPRLVFGFAPIYLWALFWYAVQITCIILAFIFVWKGEEE
jgi:hypothetical protein